MSNLGSWIEFFLPPSITWKQPIGTSRSVVSSLPAFSAAYSSPTRWKLRGLILQCGDSNGKILFQKAGVISLHCCFTLVWPGSQIALHTPVECALLLQPHEGSAQTIISLPNSLSRLQRPHFLFFQLHQAAEAALGGSVSAWEVLESPPKPLPSLLP